MRYKRGKGLFQKSRPRCARNGRLTVGENDQLNSARVISSQRPQRSSPLDRRHRRRRLIVGIIPFRSTVRPMREGPGLGRLPRATNTADSRSGENVLSLQTRSVRPDELFPNLSAKTRRLTGERENDRVKVVTENREMSWIACGCSRSPTDKRSK